MGQKVLHLFFFFFEENSKYLYFFKKDSPEWRKGPNKEDYCNACGLKYKKELKKNQEKKT